MDEEQGHALRALISNNNRVSVFRGGAGTGKSFTLREVQGELERAGHPVLVVVPQRQQVMDLENDEFKNVQTVSALLARRELPRNADVLAVAKACSSIWNRNR